MFITHPFSLSLSLSFPLSQAVVLHKKNLRLKLVIGGIIAAVVVAILIIVIVLMAVLSLEVKATN